MGTHDTWPDDGAATGGVATVIWPSADRASDAGVSGATHAEPGVRRGHQGRQRRVPPPASLAPPSHVPPQRTGRPGRRGPARPGPQPDEPRRIERPGRARQAPQSLAPGTAARPATDGARRRATRGIPLRGQRMPFFFMLCVLLGGALICALVISTTLAEGSYQITRLQQSTSALARQRQMLQAQVAAAQSAQVIERRALGLGMRPVGELRFLNLKNGKIETDAGHGQVADIHVPGYTP